ncbi:DUF6869 domain-containing protein [Mitsuaria sp. GD03876]|uniref:DUF6869 domain-containing protein n=1 Tax=Mitsuaria sp. GD03876 TaxID=2975399 RepID=UPI00244BD95B|nr:hypothetical protein [Mitsuaria sp. GD03876]MDH0865381.1 hypothetical protein [Mitsuaria sp. GD03876]
MTTMPTPLPIPQLLDEWLKWAEWISTPEPRADGSALTGWDEFEWITRDRPEHAWAAILAAVRDPRCTPYLNTLAAGPMEDLLSYHGALFIDRVEAQARSDPRFASFLGGVWRFEMTDDVWARVQAVWDRRGWDGIPSE